jgi:mitogen-activated protein kinase 15
MSEEIENHVLERYEILKKLGRGAYGIVWKVVDKRTKKTVALKKVFEAFQNSVDAQRTYREVMYLQELNGHTNIVRLMSIIRAYNNRDLYLVFEYMETDLHAVIKAKILQPIHKQFVFYQLLKALKYIHTADLIHRDLKPSNLLINSECLIKVADFGLARSIATKDDGNMPVVSDYVATRWYRAPEILLGSQAYNKSVDMWSAGCILAELISGKVLFTGKSTLNQVELIIELLGFPNNEDIESVGSPLAWNILSNIKSKKTKSVTQMFGSEGKDALDLLRKLLSFNPNKRLTVVEALNHPYVKNFHCEEDEIVCKKVIKLPLDDNVKLSLKDYREAIYKDINEKIKRSKSPTQENLPKLNDKIKSISSLERAPRLEGRDRHHDAAHGRQQGQKTELLEGRRSGGAADGVESGGGAEGAGAAEGEPLVRLRGLEGGEGAGVEHRDPRDDGRRAEAGAGPLQGAGGEEGEVGGSVEGGGLGEVVPVGESAGAEAGGVGRDLAAERELAAVEEPVEVELQGVQRVVPGGQGAAEGQEELHVQRQGGAAQEDGEHRGPGQRLAAQVAAARGPARQEGRAAAQELLHLLLQEDEGQAPRRSRPPPQDQETPLRPRLLLHQPTARKALPPPLIN